MSSWGKLSSPFGFGFKGRNPLSKLEESIEEEEIESEEEESKLASEANGDLGLPMACERLPTVSKLSSSLKSFGLVEKNLWYHGQSKGERSGLPAGPAAGSSSNRSANEQLPASANFVKLADMNDEEWGLFLEKSQDLLHAALKSYSSELKASKDGPMGDEEEEDEGLSEEEVENCPPHLRALSEAVQHGNVDALRHAVDNLQGASIDDPVEDGDIALHLACLYSLWPPSLCPAIVGKRS